MTLFTPIFIPKWLTEHPFVPRDVLPYNSFDSAWISSRRSDINESVTHGYSFDSACAALFSERWELSMLWLRQTCMSISTALEKQRSQSHGNERPEAGGIIRVKLLAVHTSSSHRLYTSILSQTVFWNLRGRLEKLQWCWCARGFPPELDRPFWFFSIKFIRSFSMPF